MREKIAPISVSPYAFISIGFEFCVIFLLCLYLGSLYDTHISTAAHTSLGLLCGLFCGFAAALWHVYQRVQSLQKTNPASNNVSHGGQKSKYTSAELSESEKARIQQLDTEIENLSAKMRATIANASKGNNTPKHK